MGRGLFLSFLCILIGTGCTQTVTVPAEERTGATANGPTPPAYCGTAKVIAGATVALTGLAEYQVRPMTGGGLGTEAQSQMLANTYPIRFAEVRITNAAGTLIQCTETDGTGAFGFLLPAGSATYTIKINSRAKNSNETINVMDGPETNRLYSIGGTFDPTATGSLNPTISTALELNAPVTNPTVLGAAFNMLDKIILSNEFLRAKTAACAVDGCIPFTVAHAVNVYWTPGFNPGDYFGAGPLSFYLPGYYRLFILGGDQGAINTVDTDHFDNSVILHEYGHFLEDSVFGSDSPGGSHNGNGVIDPRLAWSEGWGNFFQSAVLVDAGIQSSPRYQDTIGNGDGATFYAFNTDLEALPGGSGSNDYPNYFGEGVFREFSVTRMLNDALDNTPVESKVWGEGLRTDVIQNKFGTVWTGLTKNLDYGFLSPNSKFRNVGQLHAAVDIVDVANVADWDDTRGVERHISNTSEYAQYIKTGLACTDTATITPVAVAGDTGSFGTSHLMLNNDFYHLKVTSNTKIKLVYHDADDAGALADLDLIVYNTSARLGNSADWYTYSAADPYASDPTPDVTLDYTEAPTRTLAPGNYLINVFVFTGGTTIGTAVNYKLYLTGNNILCTDDLPN